jgi:hypothetical protein
MAFRMASSCQQKLLAVPAKPFSGHAVIRPLSALTPPR